MRDKWLKLPFTPNRKNIFSFTVLMILLVGLVVGVYLVGQRQIFKPKAETPVPAVPETSFTLFAQPTVKVGDETHVLVLVRSDIETANLFSAKLKFPTDLLQVKEVITNINTTCLPRPACLDANPRCLLAEPREGWCSTPSVSPLPSGQVCIQVITPACSPTEPQECRDFPTPCDVPAGWIPQDEGRVGTGVIGPGQTITLSPPYKPLKRCDSDSDCPSDYFCRVKDCPSGLTDCQTNICIPKPSSSPSSYPGFFIKNWAENNYDNNTGTISLIGGVPNPGFQTNKDNPSALFADIVFTAKKEGTANISFAGGTAIYSNINNINILTIKREVSIPIQTSTPPPQAFEIGLEAGAQHDTSKVALVVESGVKWVRLNFIGSDWSAGSSDTNTFNAIIHEYLKHNIKIIGVIGAESVKDGYDRDHPGNFTQKFVDTADTIVARFGDRVKVYELFNEPDDWAGRAGGPAQVPERYFAEFLGRIYRQIKIVEGKKDISLNSGPILSHDMGTGASYLSETYAEGKQLSDSSANWDQIKKEIGSYPLDGVGYHIYVAQGMNDVAQVETKIKANLDAFSGVINQLDPGKKIWITEFGWGTGVGRVTEDVQAANLKKAFALFQNYPAVRMAMWFTLLDFNTEEWGLVLGNGIKKKAWDSLKEVTGVVSLNPEAGYNVRGIAHYGYNDILPHTDSQDIDTTLAEIQRIGGSVIRIFLGNKKISDAEAAKRLDTLLTKAESRDISVIVSFTDFYNSGFYPQGMDQYYTNAYAGTTYLNHTFFESGYKDRYLSFVKTVVSANKNHRNIYAWEPGNELKDDSSPQTFINFMKDVTATIKSVDPSHRIATGMISAGHTALTPAALYSNLPNVDIITIHGYDSDWGNVADTEWAGLNGKIAILEEMGFKGTYDRSQATQTELNFWKGKVSAVLPWGFIERDHWSNGDGDRVVGMDTIWHSDYDKLVSILASFAGKTVPIPATPPVNGCSGNACTDCVINAKGGQGFLDFYASNGWVISCNNHNKIIDDFCSTADPAGCQSVKSSTCASSCTTTQPTSSPASTSTPISRPTPTPKPVIKGDLNGDDKITLVDMSVLLSNWGKVNGISSADLNSDGIVNSVDYSVMIKVLLDNGVIKS